MFCPKCGKELPDDSTFCPKCGHAVAATAVAPTPQAAKKPNRNLWGLLAVLGFLVVLWVANANRVNNPSSPSAPPRIFRAARTQPIANTAITVNAAGYSYYKFEVPPGATNVSVDGHFSATGGTGNDIETFVMPEDGFVNFQNGHSASAYYNSGKVTQNGINAALPGAGTYYLVLNNKFSLFTAKAVQLNATLHYTN